MPLLTAGRVLAGPALEPLDDAALVIEGTMIAWVGPRTQIPPEYREQETVDLGASTVLPGLIDAHVHLAFDGGPHPVERMRAENDAAQVALMLRSARELLSVGVTTARDLGARDLLAVTVRDAIADGTARGPRMLVAGPALTVTGGHCWFMGGEADSEQELRMAVRRLHKAGVDCIKIMSTGGNMTPGSAPWHAQFTAEELAAVVSEAHRLGKKVAAHAHGVEGIRRALAAGVDTLEHCSFQTADGTDGFDPALADAIAVAPVAVSPTCSARVLEFQRLLPPRTSALAELYQRGATIVASTDAGIDHNPHYGFVHALEAMHELGMSRLDVLRAATVTAADVLGVGSSTGSLAPGLEADLIAVPADPTADLGALHELEYVMTRGVPFTPDPVPEILPLDVDDLPDMLRRIIEAHESATAGV
ncbi:amidohydrolase family protein [Ruania rhizosphaerae]|uniref:amidohydrolase family protein n=1 Tax=Ruania rhizosphaerae TaxID=1840413 RepID=UPI001359033B|nr:amidohydrolase family protein [Ruania rhizosphaerae]